MSTSVAERPLTVQQRAMLDFIGSRVDRHYLNLETFHLHGPLDPDALREALAGVLRRHETIRSTYPAAGDVYRVAPPTQRLVDDILRVEDAPAGLPAALATGTAWAAAPMQLDTQLPLRVWLGRAADDDWVAVIAGHYLVFDAWSFMLFYEDLAGEYDRVRRHGPPRPLPPQYGRLNETAGAGELDGWAELFGRPYRAVRGLYHRIPGPLGPGAACERSWQLTGGSLAMAAKRHRVTPYVLGVAAMLRALADSLDDPQVILGSPYGGRNGADAAEVIGFLATTIFAGADLTETPGADDLIGGLNEQLRRWYQRPRTQWQPVLRHYDATDLYAVKFVFLPSYFARPSLVLDGISAERLPPPATGSIRRAVDLTAAYGRGGVTASLKYRSDVLDAATARLLLDRFETRLAELCAPEGRP